MGFKIPTIHSAAGANLLRVLLHPVSIVHAAPPAPTPLPSRSYTELKNILQRALLFSDISAAAVEPSGVAPQC